MNRFHYIDLAKGTLILCLLVSHFAIHIVWRANVICTNRKSGIARKTTVAYPELRYIDKVLENTPTKLKVSVNVNDADWQKIQELFAKERQWMTAQMQTHIREVNSMFAEKKKKVRERYKEYDGCYLGHYAQWFFWFFFTIGIFVVAGGVGMIIAQNYI